MLFAIKIAIIELLFITFSFIFYQSFEYASITVFKGNQTNIEKPFKVFTEV